MDEPDMLPYEEEIEWCRDERVFKSRREVLEELTPLDEELAAAGVPPVRDLLGGKNKYRQSIPIMCKWLLRFEAYEANSWVADTLRVPISKPTAARPLIEAFKRADNWRDPKWELGHAISCAMTDAVADDVLLIALDQRHGGKRMEIVIGLAKLKDPRTEDTLISLLSDESVNMGAVSALKKVGTQKARPYLEPFLTHKKAWLRREAKKAIENIDKRSGKPLPATAPLINRVPVDAPIRTEFEEWSTNIDLEVLEPLLKVLSSLVKPGFGKAERQQVLDACDAIDEQGAVAFDFPCKYRGQTTSFRLGVHIDDGDEADFFVFGTQALIKEFGDLAMEAIEQLDE